MKDAFEVVAIRRDDEDDIAFFKLNDGRVLNYEQCLAAIEMGEIVGLTIGKDRWDRDTIRSRRDDRRDNNLANLPEF